MSVCIVLGVEILIFATYALAFNLVLGHAGLPSFGHGAFFGIGAYAFGLAQFNVVPNLWVCLGVATLAAAMSGALVAAFISHRRGIYYALMTIAFGQVFWVVAIKAHTITGGEDGLLRIARLPASIGVTGFDLKNNVCLYCFVLVVFVGISLPLCRLALAVRAHRQGLSRMRRALRRLRRVALQGRRAGDLGGPVGACRRAVRHGAEQRVPRRHEPALLGLRGDDDAGRRRPRLFLGPGDRRRRIFPGPRRDRRADHRLDAVVRPVFSGACAVWPEGTGMSAGVTSRERKAAPAGKTQLQAR